MRLILLSACASLLLPAQIFEPEGLKSDLAILRAALDEGHPGIYRYAPKAEVDRAFQRAEAKLDHPMTAQEFFRIASPAVASLKCGHTSLMLPAAFQERIRGSVPLVPLDVRILGGRITVFRDYSDAPKLAGAEILSINGMSAARILATLLASIHGDGDTPTAGPWRVGAGHMFARALYALAGVESPFQIEFRSGGKSSKTTLAGLTQDEQEKVIVARYSQDRRPAYSATYRFQEQNATGILKIYGFGGKAEDGKPLGQFIQKAYDDLSARRAGSLIIDVRDNGGGADELGKQLFSYLVTEPFPYYQDLVINKLTFDFFRYADKPRPIPEGEVERRPNGKYLLNSHPNWGIQQPGKPYFAGPVFALMNGGSFSTTCEFLSTLHHHRRAVFIGEEAAGGYYGNTSGPGALLVLPNSKLRLPVRLMTYYMAIPGTQYGNRSIPPDHPVTYSIEELLAGKDKEMEVAMRLIERNARTGAAR